MMEPYVRALTDGEEMDEVFVEERGSRSLYGDPRDGVIETRRQAVDQDPHSEAAQ